MAMGTATDFECPKCHTLDSVDLSDGVRLCLQCRTEWRPGDTVQLPPPPPVSVQRTVSPGDVAESILQAESVAEVLDDASEFDEAPPLASVLHMVQPPPDDWTDNFVRVNETGALALVLDHRAEDELDVMYADTSTDCVNAADVTFIGDVDPDAITVTTEPAADEPMPQTILAVAGLCLSVALECVPDPDDVDQSVGNPRIGWLPPPCDQVPEAECGVAMAAALLISVFGLDKTQVAKLAANLMMGAEAGTETETDK